MQIHEIKNILLRQTVFKKTPWGFDLSNKALSFVDASINDVKNYNNYGVQCRKCGIVISILLSQNGCPNCNSKEFVTKIIE